MAGQESGVKSLESKCVRRVCVAHEFYTFYALYAFTKPVTYGKMDGLKVQVPPPAFLFQ